MQRVGSGGEARWGGHGAHHGLQQVAATGTAGQPKQLVVVMIYGTCVAYGMSAAGGVGEAMELMGCGYRYGTTVTVCYGLLRWWNTGTCICVAYGAQGMQLVRSAPGSCCARISCCSGGLRVWRPKRDVHAWRSGWYVY